MTSQGKVILLIIGGGIAAYKVLEFIRRAQDAGYHMRVVMTEAAKSFVAPLSVSTLAKGALYQDLFDPQEEMDVGHIRLSREADLVVVAPATADLLGKMAHGLANDLASAVLLANTRPVLAVPAMNPAMWSNPATRRNLAQLAQDGIRFVGPERGEMAESGEAGLGRMAEPHAILEAIDAMAAPQRLAGRHVLITAGPTHEPIDPVRYIANRSSGKQGFAIAAAAARAGAKVSLIAGPVQLPTPSGVHRIDVETALEMQAAVDAALPADIAIFAAAVADWRAAEQAETKQKKQGDGPPQWVLAENPDILKGVSQRGAGRPELVIGFAAETDSVMENAKAKRARKGCDWLVANQVGGNLPSMGGDANTVHILDDAGVESWPELSKQHVADRLIARIVEAFDA